MIGEAISGRYKTLEQKKNKKKQKKNKQTMYTVWKLSKCGVFSDPLFGPEITSYLVTFYAVVVFRNMVWNMVWNSFCQRQNFSNWYPW